MQHTLAGGLQVAHCSLPPAANAAVLFSAPFCICICICICVQLQQYLDQYIAAMQDIFDRHKAAAGYAHYKLHIM
jgi:hypothetical protein